MRVYKKSAVLLLAAATMMLSGCGKEDKLVLATTEQSETASDAETTEDILEDIKNEAESTTEREPVREEASAEDKKVTLEDIYNANKGDTLLAGGVNYSLNTIYYQDGVEVYSEYQFLGFAEDGTYLQAYEDSEGVAQVLDKEHGYWYLIQDNVTYVLIYPELGVSDAIINANHNDMIISLTEADQTIKDIYREDGDLAVETDYKTEDSSYIFKYILDDDYKVMEYYCYDTAGTKLSYSWVTEGVDYTYPDTIASAHESMMTRNVTVCFPNGNEPECTYTLPIDKPVQLRLVEYSAYSDEACTITWEESQPDDQGFYEDEVIYLKSGSESTTQSETESGAEDTEDTEEDAETESE